MLRSCSDSTKLLKKGDFILIAVVLFVALFGIFAIKNFEKKGSNAEVTVDNSIYGVYSLDETQTIDIKDENGNVTNILKIENGSADMVEADCPDQICVDHSPISKKGESIVCLPHKVVVEITAKEENGDDVDVIAE